MDRGIKDRRVKSWSVQLDAEWDLGPVVAKSISHYVEHSF
jgi:hypothetical protein